MFRKWSSSQFIIFLLPPDVFTPCSPKLIPWFVSDVTPPDFLQTIESLLDPALFFSSSPPSESQLENVKQLATKWKGYLDSGIFELSVPLQTPLGAANAPMAKRAEFWTTPWPYWNMEILAPDLWSALHESQLVIFKVSAFWMLM